MITALRFDRASPAQRAAVRDFRKQIVAASQKRRPKRALKPATPPAGVELAYVRILRDVSRAMDTIIMSTLATKGLVRKDAQGDAPSLASSEIERIAAAIQRQLDSVVSRSTLTAAINKVANRAVDYSRAEWRKQLQAALGIDLKADPNVEPLIDGFRKRNVDLIQSLADDKLERVKTVLEDAGPGTRVEQIQARIVEQTDATESRAELIARDQVLKFNAAITQTRHEAAGITKYQWSTSRDERVRPGHAALEGKDFDYASPPITDPKTGTRNNPGEDYQCRCVANPLLPGIDYDD